MSKPERQYQLVCVDNKYCTQTCSMHHKIHKQKWEIVDQSIPIPT